MSLKITVEVDGQSEQQLAPLIAQWAARHPEWLGQSVQQSAPELSASRDFYHENSALLQQQIQQLMVRNQRLEAQVANSQRLLAGVPPAIALPSSEPSASTAGNALEAASQPPLLPERYQPSKGALLRHWLMQPLQGTAHRLGRLVAWAWLGRQWLLIFLLLCGGMTSVLLIAPVISERLWPEFVESEEGGPGATTAKPKGEDAPKPDKKKDLAPPALPTSKAGSHPPPPPAFQQQ
jgi:hypothetical protein